MKNINKEQLNLTPTEKIKHLERQARIKKWASPKLRSTLSLVLALVLLISGSTAYFTDRAHNVTTATAGTVQVSVDDSNVNLLNADGLDILNPGDVRNVGFTIQNEGNKSVDAKVIITLTSSVPMTEYSGGIIWSLRSSPVVATLGTGEPSDYLYEGFVYASEYELYNASDVVAVEGYGHYPKDGTTPLQSRVQNTTGTKTVYEIDSLVLSGNSDLNEQELEWEYIPDVSAYAMNYLKSESRYYRYYNMDFSSYIDGIGTICFAEVRSIDYQANGKTVVFPASCDYGALEYIEVSYLINADVSNIAASSSIKGFLYYDYDAGGYVILSASELEEREGINVELYDDFDEKFTVQRISDLEYSKLDETEKTKYSICGDSKTYDLVLLFDPNSGNEFQNSNVSIEIEIYAKQHRNTNDDAWVETDSVLSSIIQDSIFTVDYDKLRRVTLTGLKPGVDWDSLTEITIPHGVEVIPSGFFYNCTNIEKVNLPDTIEEISSYAFSDCTNLAKIDLPDGLEVIDYNAFSNCTNLTSITIPGSVTYMGEYMFEDSGLETVVIEEGVTELGCGAFKYAYNLSSVELPSTLKKIGNECFTDCSNLTSIEIPYGVTYIDCAFVRTGLTEITIPNSVTFLSGYTFSECTDLTTVTLSNQLTRIDSGLFENCTSLTFVTIDGYEPNVIDGNIEKIGAVAFENTKITEIVIGDSVTYIENNAFRYCDELITITIGDNVNYIGYTAFRCSSTVVTTVYTNNQEAIDFNWSRYYRTVTILPLEG